MIGLWTGNVRSTPTPKLTLRTVNASRTPSPAREITTPANTWIRDRFPSTTLTCTFTVSPGRKEGTSSRRDAESSSLISLLMRISLPVPQVTTLVKFSRPSRCEQSPCGRSRDAQGQQPSSVPYRGYPAVIHEAPAICLDTLQMAASSASQLAADPGQQVTTNSRLRRRRRAKRIQPEQGSTHHRQRISYLHRCSGRVPVNPPRHLIQQLRLPSREHSAAQYDISGLIPYPQPVDRHAHHQEHLLRQPVYDGRRQPVTGCRGPQQHRRQFMDPGHGQPPEVQGLSHFGDRGCPEVLLHRLPKQGLLSPAVFSPYGKEQSLHPERATATPITRDGAHRRKLKPPLACRLPHAVDTGATHHTDPVRRLRPGPQQG